MIRTRWWSWGIVVLVLGLVVPGSARPDEGGAGKTNGSPLAQVPAKAVVVVHLRGVERTKERLMTLVKNAAPELGTLAQAKFDQWLGSLDGRELKGLPKDGDVFLALTEMPTLGQDDPAAAFILRVNDYKQFRDAILKEEERKALKADSAGYESTTMNEKEVFFVDRKGYVIATPKKDLAIEFTKNQPGLDTKLNPGVAKQLMENDLAVYVDMEAVNKEFGDQIKGFRQLLPTILEQGAEAAKMDKSAQEMLKGMIEGVFQLVEDSQALLLAADFRPEGLALRALTRVGAATPTNKLLKEGKPGSLDDLGKLPAGQMGYYGVQYDPGLVKAILPLMGALMGGASGKSNEGFRQAMEEQIQAGPERMIGDYNMPVEGITVWHYKDPAKAAAAQLKTFQSLQAGATYANAMLKDKPVVQADAQEHRGFKLSSVSMTYDFDKMAETLPGGKEAAEALKKMLGESLHAWFGTDGKQVVQMAAKNWEAAQKTLDDYLDGKNQVGQQALFRDARKQLPAQATLVGLIDGPQYLQMLTQSMGQMFQAQGLPFNVPALKATKGKGFLGFAVTLVPEQGSFDFCIPVSTFREIHKMIAPHLGELGVQ